MSLCIDMAISVSLHLLLMNCRFPLDAQKLCLTEIVKHWITTERRNAFIHWVLHMLYIYIKTFTKSLLYQDGTIPGMYIGLNHVKKPRMLRGFHAWVPGTWYTFYSISQEICTRFLLCCALLWLYIDWFSHIHQAYFTGTVAIWRLPQCQQSNPDEYG